MPAIVPEIMIELAPPELEPEPEPYSPLSCFVVDNDPDSFRPSHLTPPPSAGSPCSGRPLSPLRPSETVVTGQGLARDRFEALLNASRERNASVGAKKTNDLRKEIALKVHGKKQIERRALFLSKVLAPPSPTATFLPKTPPESPAIFNYTLPSPGLVSPLALFETLNETASYTEQVDYRLPPTQAKSHIAHKASHPAKPLPSLDQISARMTSKGHVRTPSAEAAERKARLPAFLAQAPPSINIGRLHLPIRPRKPEVADSAPTLPPRSPCYPLSPKLQITTLVVPRTSSLSPTELSESNLMALNAHSRERRAKDMLSTLRKRTGASVTHDEALDRKWKRLSAPAELSPRVRTGFESAAFLF